MSNLRTIYTNLAAKTVTVVSPVHGSQTPPVRDLDELPAFVEAAQCPVRLLLPIGPGRGESREGQFICLGTTGRSTWHVTDLLLWRPIEEGLSLESVAVDLVLYAAAYIEMLRTFRSPASQCILKEWQIVTGRFNYPSGSANWFFGVECSLDIEEVLTG